MSVISAIRAIVMSLCKPCFEAKNHGSGGGIPALKKIWHWFDLSLLFSECGIRKHAGAPAWVLCFVYVAGLISSASTNKVVQYFADSPIF